MKRKGRMALAVALIAAAVGLFSIRDTLMVRLFPKVVLSKAITSAFQELETRYKCSPVHLLERTLDPDGQQRISMKLDTATDFLGAAHYDLELQTQAGPNRVYAQGSVSTGDGRVDLKLFLDEDFAALSSQSLTEGAYYGITYDSFPEDIRSFSLLRLFAGVEKLRQWDASVTGLAELMRTNLSLPELKAEDIQTVLLGSLALKPQVQAQEEENCFTVTFREKGTALAKLTEPYLDQAPEALANLVKSMALDAVSELRMDFFLQEDKLIGLEVGIITENDTYQIAADISGESLLGVEFSHRQGESLQRTELTIETKQDSESYQEKIVLTQTRNGVQEQTMADYAWDISTGDLVLDLVKNERQYPIRLNLKGEGESFCLTTQEFGTLLSAITGKESSRSSICTLKVSPGEGINAVPEHKNLADWSAEDLMLLLSHLGDLVGFHLP